MSAHEDRAAALASLAAGSKTFRLAGRLLPRELLEDAAGVYAFCRHADDRVDAPGATLGDLDPLARVLDATFGGGPLPPDAPPALRAFAEVVARRGLPRAPFDAMLEGFRWDLEGRTYETLDELEAYCVRVAGTVGVSMAHLMGARDGAALARAVDLGVAMQLTNVCRDVGEDARRGRTYLPQAALRRSGAPDPRALRAWDPRLAPVVEQLLARADALYRSAEAGISALPAAYRPAIGAARGLYAEIGELLRERGGDGYSARAVVPPARKVVVALGAAVRARLRGPAPHALAAPPSGVARGLVQACEERAA